MRCAIVGAGMAGLACADVLARAGHTIALFDKGHGAGGRMSTRRVATPLGDVAFDYGAQYFTARDPGFCAQVDAWYDLDVVTRWPLVAPDAWVGHTAMNTVIKHMAAAHVVTWGHAVTSLARDDRGWRLIGAPDVSATYDAVVLAIPAEQAATILSLHDFAMARIALMARSRPCWTSMFVFDGPLGCVPDIIRTGTDLTWATRNSAKPDRSGPEAWVVQASATWSEARMESTPDDIAAALYRCLSEAAACSLPAPVAEVSHRWRYALSAGTGDGALWQSALKLGVCGDWLLGPRVECAWLSGTSLGETMIGS